MRGKTTRNTNLKPITTGAEIVVAPAGCWMYGEVGPTDLVGFTHYYTPAGVKTELGEPYKATLGNLILTNEVESNIPTDPPIIDELIQLRISKDSGATWGVWQDLERVA